MKKYIEYYYECKVDTIDSNSYGYDVVVEKKKYLLKMIENLEVIQQYEKTVYYIERYDYFFKVVPTRYNLLYIVVNDKIYIMLKLSNIINERLSIYDIKTNLYLGDDIFEFNYGNVWIKKWENKIDYLELWLKDRKGLSSKLYPIIQFYIGLGELGILYLKNNVLNIIPTEYDKTTLQHNRITVDSYLYDYYDPTNVVVDHNCRDLSEYIKSICISDLNISSFIDTFREYLNTHRFSKFGIRLLYGRIIFPTYFFDNFEKIIRTNNIDDFEDIKDVNIKWFENSIVQFEKNIRIVNNLFKSEYNVEVIDTI